MRIIHSTYSATNFIKITNVVQSIQLFRLQSSLFQMNMQSHLFGTNSSNFAQLFFVNTSNVSVMNVTVLCVFKLSVQSVRQLQQHTTEVFFEMTALPYQ